MCRHPDFSVQGPNEAVGLTFIIAERRRLSIAASTKFCPGRSKPPLHPSQRFPRLHKLLNDGWRWRTHFRVAAGIVNGFVTSRSFLTSLCTPPGEPLILDLL
jgi:hypothetical protein